MIKSLSETHLRAVRLVLAALLLSGSAAVLTACNTTAGAGEDVSAIGHGVTHAAESAKP